MKHEPLERALARVRADPFVLRRVALPQHPVIGPRCNHPQPICMKQFEGTCPHCGNAIAIDELQIDALALGIRRLIAELDNHAEVMYANDMTWCTIDGRETFHMQHVTTDDAALEWLNARSFEELRELPGVDISTAMLLQKHMPLTDPLMEVPDRFLGPHSKRWRKPFLVAVRGHRIRHSADRVCPDIKPKCLEHSARMRIRGFSAETTKVLAAIAASIYEKKGDFAASMFLDATNTSDVDGIVAAYNAVFPEHVQSVALHLTLVEPYLRSLEFRAGSGTLAQFLE